MHNRKMKGDGYNEAVFKAKDIDRVQRNRHFGIIDAVGFFRGKFKNR